MCYIKAAARPSSVKTFTLTLLLTCAATPIDATFRRCGLTLLPNDPVIDVGQDLRLTCAVNIKVSEMNSCQPKSDKPFHITFKNTQLPAGSVWQNSSIAHITLRKLSVAEHLQYVRCCYNCHSDPRPWDPAQQLTVDYPLVLPSQPTCMSQNFYDMECKWVLPYPYISGVSGLKVQVNFTKTINSCPTNTPGLVDDSKEIIPEKEITGQFTVFRIYFSKFSSYRYPHLFQKYRTYCFIVEVTRGQDSVGPQMYEVKANPEIIKPDRVQKLSASPAIGDPSTKLNVTWRPPHGMDVTLKVANGMVFEVSYRSKLSADVELVNFTDTSVTGSKTISHVIANLVPDTEYLMAVRGKINMNTNPYWSALSSVFGKTRPAEVSSSLDMCEIDSYFGYKASRSGKVAKGIKVTHNCATGFAINGDVMNKQAIKATCLGNNKWDKFDKDIHKCLLAPRISQLVSKGWDTREDCKKLTIVCKVHFMPGQADSGPGHHTVKLYEIDRRSEIVKALNNVTIYTQGWTVIISKETPQKVENDYRCVAEQRLKGGHGFVLRRTLSGVRSGEVMVGTGNTSPPRATRQPTEEDRNQPVQKGGYSNPTDMRLDGINGKMLQYGSKYPITCSATIGFVEPDEATNLVRVIFAKVETERSRRLYLPTQLSYDPMTGRITASATLLIMSRFTKDDKLSCSVTVPGNTEMFKDAAVVLSDNFKVSEKDQETFEPDLREEAYHYVDSQDLAATIQNAGPKAKISKAIIVAMILAAAIPSR